ncbi:head maturation protease, ClpP-related [Lactobacillus mulieris]|uniref:ATP-dependent Clp protease proteolytic subunit n=1 Tax=Lactobacillus mulieris TaxID=2508708 RepID=A0AAP3M2N0_9LACO|nr:head maturation protease, ClpP-related [Lactobacillus mulieris]MCW8123450.1 Clp protease ClpP [Lactobacillus mulieris]MCZ3844160.1 Clp protease ClpP [Lactobacillus mulieris]MCZ3875820.1 Clp protease ClpP [Lactobacillus mulieris]MDK7326613.1 Clp protease ClpP [Lactobacillus mulieris]WEB30141.1 Clp protease ClpP [Lactobacillus mulieris]
MKKINQFLTINEFTETTADMSIDGSIGNDYWDEDSTSASDFRDALKDIGNVKTINLHINSPGGNVFDGISIYNMLKQNKAHVNVYIDGVAASIASVIAMAGDTIFIPNNAMLMIHNPWTYAQGNAKELRKIADDLDKMTESSKTIYLEQAGDKLTEEKLTQLMDEETWINASEALEYGFVDEIIESQKAVACADKSFLKHYKNVPNQLLNKVDLQALKKSASAEAEAIRIELAAL